ncbi:acetate/propionate family kinase [Thermodesulfobacteriota bacterium]
MKILVINTGSSSIKYQLFNMKNQEVLCHGVVERIGEETGTLTHEVFSGEGDPVIKTYDGFIPDHEAGFSKIVDCLMNNDFGVIKDRKEISAVGHRVVHGGEIFKKPTVINDDVIKAITDNIPLAPLHNPSNLTGIEVAISVFPESHQVAVFDTAFHQSIPPHAFMYALPYKLYKKDRVRRYGFHGTSHAYVTEKCADFLGKQLHELNIITIHLGNGASMAAIKKGECVDTSMGMTPLEGLVMGTRTGDVDPALPFFLADHLNMNLKEIDNLLNKESGLKGMCGTNDMREVIAKMDEGDINAELALDVYTYRIKKYIGAYFAVLEDLDAVVFTAGIGEHAPRIREFSCRGLHNLGINIDIEKNNMPGNSIREISTQGSKVKVLVIPTNEELRIAQETKKIIDYI